MDDREARLLGILFESVSRSSGKRKVGADDGHGFRPRRKAGKNLDAAADFLGRLPYKGKIIFEPAVKKLKRAGGSGCHGITQFFGNRAGSHNLARPESAQ